MPSRTCGVNSTDRLEARLIASFCQTPEPAAWSPPAVALRQLRGLVRRVETLEEMRQSEQNRLAHAAPEVQLSIERIIALLTQEIQELEQQTKEHIDSHPELKEQSELLQTIPGIGEKTANLLLSEIEFARYDSARAGRGTSRSRAAPAAVGNELKTKWVVEVRQCAVEKSVVLSGDSG